MRKVWAIAWKELYRTLHDRNLILIMFATPLLLSTIIGLAFGGLGGDSLAIGAIDVAVVNLDEGFDIASLISGTVNSTSSISTSAISTSASISNGAILTGLPTNFALNTGDIVASILLGEAITATGAISDSSLTVGNMGACPLIAESSTVTEPNNTQGSLSELLHATRLTDAAAARQGVDAGDYAVAVLIPAGFTQTFLPSFGLIDNRDLTNRPQVEVYGNSGDALSASIVNSIVRGIVSQFERLPVTLEASIDTLLQRIDLNKLDPNALAATLNELRSAAARGDFSRVSTSPTGTGTITETFAILGCLFTPGINPVSLVQQPLNQLQESSTFGRVLVIFGSAQALFFALFTGVFGILSIYEERKQWTLQRMLASPTSGNTILLGKLLGNLMVVIMQLLVLMLALTAVATIASGTPTMIWGTHFGLLLVTVLLVSLSVSGIGVLIVGVARTPEQVQIVGPLVNTLLGMLGGSFGFSLPPSLSKLSLIYWGTSAFEKLASGQADIGINLLMLALQGLFFFVVGSWFFRRRLNLS